MSFSRHFTNCEHEKYRHFAAISRVFVVFYNVNTVRSEMWVWDFPNHSSSTRDLENTILTFPPHSILSILTLCKLQSGNIRFYLPLYLALRSKVFFNNERILLGGYVSIVFSTSQMLKKSFKSQVKDEWFGSPFLAWVMWKTQ